MFQRKTTTFIGCVHKLYKNANRGTKEGFKLALIRK
jgi:hypothetical protein